MMLEVKLRRNKRWLWLAIVGVVVLVIAAAVWWVGWGSEKSDTNSQNIPQIVERTPQPTGISSNVLMLGNTFWGRYINDWSMASPLKYEYPFSRLNEFQRNTYDAWISGLECPTAADVHMTSAQMEEALQFNCSPEYLPEAAKWFTAFSLANNHTDNQGVDGFAETREQLDKNGIQHFGHYDPRVIEDVCEVISLPVTVALDNHDETKGKLPVAMCGFHGVFRIPPVEAVAQMQKYAEVMPVIAFPHMGVEYRPTPDALKTSFYRSLIDGGADMVIGDHPHWIQTTESYKGHLIVYSMGNFMFDQQDTPEVIRSAAIRVVMQTGGDTGMLAKWLAVGEGCSTFQDDCLAQIKKQGLAKLPMTYKFDAIGTNDGDKIVKPASKDQQASILQRLNWRSTMDQLRAPYSSL